MQHFNVRGTCPRVSRIAHHGIDLIPLTQPPNANMSILFCSPWVRICAFLVFGVEPDQFVSGVTLRVAQCLISLPGTVGESW
jgi:hypothetical protein